MYSHSCLGWLKASTASTALTCMKMTLKVSDCNFNDRILELKVFGIVWKSQYGI